MQRITSVHNPRVKAAARLRVARERTRQGRFLIDGLRELRRAIAAGIELDELFVCSALEQSPPLRDVLAQLPAAATLEVSPVVFARLAYGDRTEGVVAVARAPQTELSKLRLPAATARAPLVSVLAGLEKPGNVGAVLRSADAAGVSAVIVADGRTDLFNPNVIRASAGAVFSVPLAADSAPAALAWLRERQLAIYAARVDAQRVYTDVAWTQPSAIVLGSEAAGLCAEWTAPDVIAICLPMLGAADSLNVSVTAAVVFYEALRQREASARVPPAKNP